MSILKVCRNLYILIVLVVNMYLISPYGKSLCHFNVNDRYRVFFCWVVASYNAWFCMICEVELFNIVITRMSKIKTCNNLLILTGLVINMLFDFSLTEKVIF